MLSTTIKIVSLTLAGVAVLWIVAVSAVSLPSGAGAELIPEPIRDWLQPAQIETGAATTNPNGQPAETAQPASSSTVDMPDETPPTIPTLNIATPRPAPPDSIDRDNAPFLQKVSLCPFMAVSNAPPSDSQLRVSDFSPYVLAEDRVALAAAPVQAGCLSSGFGPRGSGTHRGVDYHNNGSPDVYAAASGTVKRRLYRDDFGNMVVIDHGDGVFTRYAHLRDFDDISEGDPIEAGDVLGQMGSTGNGISAIHLHFEVLVGEWDDRAGSFALTPVNVFALPSAD